MTNSALKTSFDRDGYVVLDRALNPGEVDKLLEEAVRICRGERGDISGALPAGAGDTDDEVLRKFLCVHYPHKLSGLMLATMRHPAVVSALTSVIGQNVKAMQSMLFIKSEGEPGQAWHQDELFIPTRDRSLTAAWIALDDATVANGCLWVLPGSHRRGVLYPNREHDDPRYDCTMESYGFPFRDSDAVPVEVPAGSVVVFNGYLLHKSLPNTAAHGYRRALVNHYMSAESLLPWATPPEGTGMAQADFRDVVLVAGEDPYAYKGFEDVRKPRIRPNREGGCDR
ncbi:phytanoyl-CoA dioxygenase family protein [Nonomuraea jiangxiensis]|uniref:Ectoine hydroxylase-related dioxygenase, phytanoyl-CoA dioxygenase (PhyH) family n=1 Tax=Nonomuraea jiangxiensis TaxID=633440 RepID=A0A1G8XXE6_9ACTN|nr:phytanoyl-CoA dioxygenase family protein [Nonomuraea jiangxiensis]SDJ95201.1 Ectoine hydroxylase-related dioxygenase, phytanoyl-CoA dioxygenase (PhyH) family [Nonomuraea jiangxiensis]